MAAEGSQAGAEEEAAAAAGSGRRSRSVFDLAAGIFALVSLIAEWTIGIAPAHLPQTFGYETPACWLAFLGVAAALVLDVGYAVWALTFTEVVLAVWFGWAVWVVTTPRFTQLDFPFTPTDVLGTGFYVAGLALVAAAAAVIRDLERHGTRLGGELWLLTALPGFGLVRMGRRFAGVTCLVLFVFAIYLASTDSPGAAIFEEYGRQGGVPPPYPRVAEWVLLGAAATVFAVSVVLTFWHRQVAKRAQSALN